MDNLKIEQFKDSKVFIVEIKGGMDPFIFNRIQEFFDERPENEKVRILGVFKDFEDFDEIKNFVQGISLDISKIKKLEKYAMVSDKRWFEKILKLEGKLIPGIPFKYFSISNREGAMEWLQEN